MATTTRWIEKVCFLMMLSNSDHDRKILPSAQLDSFIQSKHRLRLLRRGFLLSLTACMCLYCVTMCVLCVCAESAVRKIRLGHQFCQRLLLILLRPRTCRGRKRERGCNNSVRIHISRTAARRPTYPHTHAQRGKTVSHCKLVHSNTHTFAALRRISKMMIIACLLCAYHAAIPMPCVTCKSNGSVRPSARINSPPSYTKSEIEFQGFLGSWLC